MPSSLQNPVSSGIGGLALPAVIGDRSLYPEQDGYDFPRATELAPAANRGGAECGCLHGLKSLAKNEVRA